MPEFGTQYNDPDLAEIMQGRYEEASEGFTLIASEGDPHPEDVAAAADAVKAKFPGGYYEGFPRKGKPGKGRYYQQCEWADRLEEVARDRVVKVLARSAPELASANVQCPTGCVANTVAYLGVLESDDVVVAPSLADGYGHLSHASGDGPNVLLPQLYEMHAYGINDEGLLDYDAIESLVDEKRPRLLLGGASSYPRDIDWERMVAIAEKYGALTMADISHPAGLVAADVLNDPFAAGVDIITTTTHKTLGGLKGAVILFRKNLKDRVESVGGKYTGINRASFPGLLGGPDMERIAGHASTFRRAQTSEFKEVQDRTAVNATILAEELMKHGWPVMTNGTDNHIVLISDVRKIDGLQAEVNKDGWEAAIALEQVGLGSNKNAVPGQPDDATPVRPFGLRLGTPEVSQRGMGPDDIPELAEIIDASLREAGNAEAIGGLRQGVRHLAKNFPIPDYENESF